MSNETEQLKLEIAQKNAYIMKLLDHIDVINGQYASIQLQINTMGFNMTEIEESLKVARRYIEEVTK